MRKPDSLALAIQEFDSIIRIDPKIADAYYNLGLCHYLLGDYEKSIMAFKKVLNVNPKDEQAKTMSSLLYDQQQ
ncbi:MAG: tetratricopeptide repeat protein [Vulcanimicrobiota bacterium]